MTHKFVTGFITTDTVDSARKIVTTLLEKKLIACANISGQVESHYWWHGEIHRSSEIVIWLKSLESFAAKIETEVAKIHPYECPCIVFTPLIHMNAEFAEWLKVVLTK